MKSPFLIPIVCFIFGTLIGGIPAVVLGGKILFVILTLELIALSSAVFITKKYIFYFLLGIYFLTLGVFRVSGFSNVTGNDISQIISSEEETCLVYGAVITEPERKGNSVSVQKVFLLKPEKVLVKGKEFDVNGLIQVRLFSVGKRPAIGDVVFAGGKIKIPDEKTNPYQFDYKKYMETKGIRAVLSSKETDYYLKIGELRGISFRIRKVLSKLRESASRTIDERIGGIASEVFKAIIMGVRTDIPGWVNDVFIKTGTMHILAISGLHIGILMFIVFNFLKFLRIPVNVSCIFTIGFILFFAVFAGARSSLIRAAIMGVFLMLGILSQRNISSIYSLLFSAFVILFIYPRQILDSGFILSYCAVLSIFFIVPFVDSFFNKESPSIRKTYFENLRFRIYQLFSVSVSVWIGIMPLIAFYFGILTPFVFLINFVAIPFLFLIIILGTFFFVFCLIPIGVISAIPAVLIKGCISIFLRTLTGFIKMPMSFVKVSSPSIVVIVAYYAMLLALIILLRKGIKKKALLPVFLLSATILFVSSELSAKIHTTFSATFFDAGKADTALLEFQDNSVVLIDGGTGEGAFSKDAGKEILGPYLRNIGIRSIDIIILSHPHGDHIGGLFYILDNFKVGCILTANWEKIFKENQITEESDSLEMFRKLKKISVGKGVEMIYVESGDRIEGIEGVKIDVFNPDLGAKYSDFNNASVVVKLINKYNKSILFCGDVEEQGIQDILCFGDRIRSDYIKFPHHGGHIGKKETVEQFLGVMDNAKCIITNESNSNLSVYVKEILNKNNMDYFVVGEDGAIIIYGKEDKLCSKEG